MFWYCLCPCSLHQLFSWSVFTFILYFSVCPKFKKKNPRPNHRLFIGCLLAKSCLTLRDPMDCVPRQAPLSMGLSRQGHWGGLPFPPPGHPPLPGMEPEALALAGGSLWLSHEGSWFQAFLQGKCEGSCRETNFRFWWFESQKVFIRYLSQPVIPFILFL